MQNITFFDTEVDQRNQTVVDFGAIKGNDSYFHGASVHGFENFLNGTEYLCGHNVVHHDVQYIRNLLQRVGIGPNNIIDTLFLSPLLFPKNPYHALVKDDKLQTEELNNPLNDSKKARYLFQDEVDAYQKLDSDLAHIYFLLLHQTGEFRGFFRFMGSVHPKLELVDLIKRRFKNEVCDGINWSRLADSEPIALAYALSLIEAMKDGEGQASITPPWVLKNFPDVERILSQLRNTPCVQGCSYCDSKLDIHLGLKKFFGFESYRKYDDEPLQEQAVAAAVNHKSIIAVFPTGGGKSITFQVPALISGESSRSLTVIISPLQSLMKDQVDNLEEHGITQAVTINGLLDPIERAKSFQRVEDGSATLLYISPESLRSRTIEKLLLGRKIARFVIDEAHCFSAWGQDFRVDYLYIGDFIKSLQEKKKLSEGIPVSCFTATAKRKVIEDIKDYFRDKLGLDLDVFSSSSSRKNLTYRVFQKDSNDDKYFALRDLIEEKNCPTIVYASRTKTTESLAKRLSDDGFNARAYHGKMEAKVKTLNQNEFIAGNVGIMVATSAFGMGVDKKDVGLVVHYEISDSLENYVQEAGRAGRDENIVADCYVLYNEEDLGKHFVMLNQTKLSIKEIQQVWRAIKDLTKLRSKVSNSALEIARKAGWDDAVAEIETRVKTAIAALEGAGYLKRSQNVPRVFANSILAKNAQDAIDKIEASNRFDQKQKVTATRIIKKLIASRSRKGSPDDQAESRIDYISDHLGITKEEVINTVGLLREEKILADDQDLAAYIRRTEQKNRSLQILKTFIKLESFLLDRVKVPDAVVNIKELNELAEQEGLLDISTQKIKRILNFWVIRKQITQKISRQSKNHLKLEPRIKLQEMRERLEKRQELSAFILSHLFEQIPESDLDATDSQTEEVLVEFSVHALKKAYLASESLFKVDVDIADIEDALFYLSRIEAIKIEGGFMVIHNSLTIERLEENTKKQYTKDDYQKLNDHYENKTQQIHIVGEYAKKMIEDYSGALQFVEDYFQLNYSAFLKRYFPGSKLDNLKLKMTPAKFQQLFGDLSPPQLSIIKDNEARYIVIAAGPGSGKTKVLVHKLASLLLMEDVKHEQLLMLTFSRAAATEFKKRLIHLIGNAANFVEIKTFHSYCFDLLGKVGDLDKSNSILKVATQKIIDNEVEQSRITKTVLVIDEAQDMNEDEFGLIRALMSKNEEMRVIAVGDDDQNIFAFRGSSSEYLQRLISHHDAATYELLDNYRSSVELVQYFNSFVSKINHRLKKNPIISRKSTGGKIRIIKHDEQTQRNSTLMIPPLVDDIISIGLSGTCGVLVKTNYEALQITGQLLKNGFPAKLIQSNDGFLLYNVDELRYFFNLLKNGDNDKYFITDEEWENAKSRLTTVYARSTKLELLLNLTNDFEVTNPKRKFLSDLEVFIRESSLEDLHRHYGESILVSTIHKAKGREFDNVFLLLDNFRIIDDASKRLLYVAMSRAKSLLNVHTNNDCLKNTFANNLHFITHGNGYNPINEIVLQPTLKDVWLDFFISKQQFLNRAISGDKLTINGNLSLSLSGQEVVRFSKKFTNDSILPLLGDGYRMKEAKVNFVLWWQKEDSNREIKVILPEIILEKSGDRGDEHRIGLNGV
ncbi:MAG: ATP-dependent DNA helicase RecQ [Bacteroidetes bacterium HLUCCA01]|nr:MAG: ATP-dependent DNA helicase RecQ [Bacteroidetes bacterium HLUCCA01]